METEAFVYPTPAQMRKLGSKGLFGPVPDKEAEEAHSIAIIHKYLFPDTSLKVFNKRVNKIRPPLKENFIRACRLIIESSHITTINENTKILLLFVAIESLMNDVKYIDFKQWLETRKKVFGSSSKEKILKKINIHSKASFVKYVQELYSVYAKKYGITNKVRKFFVAYITDKSKKKLIRLISFEKRDINSYVHKCFISKEICFSKKNNYGKCYDNVPECALKTKRGINSAISKLVSFLYSYVRSGFVHEGKRGYLADNSLSMSYDEYDGKGFFMAISYSEMKDVVLEGIKRFYTLNSKN